MKNVGKSIGKGSTLFSGVLWNAGCSVRCIFLCDHNKDDYGYDGRK